ncbi:MAG: hypothetical protein ACLPTJ_20025, partial [Solirubrobacteraceae bacterium]
VRCVMLPAVLEILGPATWWLPKWLDARLPRINIEGTEAAAAARDADRVRATRSEEAGEEAGTPV